MTNRTISPAKPATDPTTPPAMAPIGGSVVGEGLTVLVAVGMGVDSDTAADGEGDVVGFVGFVEDVVGTSVTEGLGVADVVVFGRYAVESSTLSRFA